MDIPSRRARKQTNSRWSARTLITALFLLPAISFMVYIAVYTGNYMGLASVSVFVFFFSIGLNLGNVRRFLPGLASENKEIKYPAVFIYTCLGFTALTMAAHLPASHDFLPLNMLQQQPDSSQKENASAKPADEQPVNDLSLVKEAKLDLPPTPPPGNRPEETTTVTKMAPATNNMVVTKVINAHIIEINNQQLVRLIGVQVPDHMQKQAAAMIEKMVNNQQVALTICTERPEDEYGRTRAVVMVKGINVNKKLIETGYSPLIITLPCSIDLASWQSAENLAKQQKRGIWAKHPE